MKRLFLISLLVFVASSLFAQKKGDMMVSGSISYSAASNKVKVDSESEVSKGIRNFSIMPEFHYFIADKFSVGLGLGYSLNKTPNKNADNGDDQLFNKLGLFMVQPVASYYVSLGNNFYYVPRFYVGYGTGKYKQETSDSSTEENNVSAFNVGFSILNFEFKPVERIGIRFNAGDLSYQTTSIDLGDDVKSSERKFNLGLNMGATIGFNLYF